MTKILKRPLSIILAVLMVISLFVAVPATASAADTPEVTLTFPDDEWNIPTNNTTDLNTYTNGTYSIKLYAPYAYKMNSGYLLLGKKDAYLELPAFDFAVEKIVVTGASTASGRVNTNIYVGGNEASSTVTGSTGVNTFDIASDYQSAGNAYRLKIENAYNAQITKIEIYKAEPAPAPEVVLMDVDDYKGDTATQEVPESATSGKVFAGWFEDENCTTPYTGTSGQAYAKFVDEDIHNSWAQMAVNTTLNSATTDIRFATLVDSLDYQKVGFEITLNSKTATTESRTAHTLLQGGDKTYEPSEYSNQASYFVTFVLKNIPNEVFNDTFSVRSYWITLDGTKVYGSEKTFKIKEKI